MAVGGGHTRPTRAASRLAGLSLVPAVLLAACGSSGGAPAAGASAALTSIHRAVARTEAAGTAHLVQSDETRSTTGGTSTGAVSEDSLSMVGDIRFAGPDLSLTTTSRSNLSSSTGTPSNSTTTTSSRSVYLDGHLYMAAGQGAVWNELAVRTPFPYLGIVTTHFLATATGPVTDAGHREIDGRATTEYLVPVPGSVRSVALTDSHNRPYTARFTTAPFTLAVWLDGAGRIVRTSGAEVVTSPEPTGTVRATTTVTLSAFGEPVHIVAPARTQPS